MKHLFNICRLLLAIVLLTFGLNGYLRFYPLPPTTVEAESFLNALWASGYLMPLEKALEILIGVLLLANRFLPLALLIFFPLAVNIVLVDTLLQPQYWYFGGSVFLLCVILLFKYRSAYAPIFQYKP